MKLPLETILALYPQSTSVGEVKLLPLTIGGWVALSVCGIDPLAIKIHPGVAHLAAAILAKPSFSGLPTESDIKEQARSISGMPIREICNAVESILNQAFMTYIEARKDDNSPVSLTPHGLGTPLELAEFLMAEYGWKLNEALTTPVATAFALVAAARQRNGGKHKGFDYIEREYIEKEIKGNHGG